MLTNYLKIFFRQLFSHKINSLIHLGGIAVGVASVLLLMIYVNFEKSFDGDLTDSDQLYRVNLTSFSKGDLIEKSARTSPAMGEAFMEEVASVEDFSRVVILGEVIAGYDDQNVREEEIFITDQKYFEFFDVAIQRGDLSKMNEPLQAMISQSISEKIFGSTNPVGKTLKINSTNFDGTVDFEVAGVYEPLPENRHLQPEILISYATLHHFIGKEIDQSYDWLNQYTYLKLSSGADIPETELAINESLQKHYGENLKAKESTWDLTLQPVSSIHTTMDVAGEFAQGIDGKKLSYFVWIGVFVLLMIYLNSVNISNAKAMNRAKEIGVRKVSGGNRFQLFFQLMIEASVSNLIAVALAGVLVILMGVELNSALDLGLENSLFHFKVILPYLIGFWIVGTLISGIYPALILTAFSASKALKGTLKFKLKSAFARPLLVSQLVFCLIIIAGVLTVYRQLDFMKSQNLGLDLQDKLVFRSPMLYVEGSGNYQEQIQNSIAKLPSVEKVAATEEIPGNEVYWRTDAVQLEGKEKSGVMFSTLDVGKEYFDLFEINFIAGKNFNASLGGGEEAIINLKAMRSLGVDRPEDIIGATLQKERGSAIIVGVVEDFRQQGVQVEVAPMVLNYSPRDLKYYAVSISGDDPELALNEIKGEFEKSYASSPFEYYFLDEHFDRQYKSELQFVKLFGIASLIAIFIAVMGILGVTNQLAIQKNKEISIRKILGANPIQILNMITGEYFVWLAICFLVGIPFSYYLLSGWLENFQLQVDLGWWFYFIPALTILGIFLLTTMYQTLKTIFINPAKILKDE